MTKIKYFITKADRRVAVKLVKEDLRTTERRKPERKYHINLKSDAGMFIAEMSNAKQVYPRKEFAQTDKDICVYSVLWNEESEKQVQKVKEDYYAEKLMEKIVRYDNEELALTEREAAKIEADMDFSKSVFDSLEQVKAVYPQTAGTFEIVSTDEEGKETVIKHDRITDGGWAL